MITPIELIQRVIPHMTAQGFGRIVNITSISVRMPIPGLDVSSAARAGLAAFIAGPARELARYNVTVNNLLPGMFDTDRLRDSTRRTWPRLRRRAMRRWPRSAGPPSHYSSSEQVRLSQNMICPAHQAWKTFSPSLPCRRQI
jgi:3-oxoacyl-[acyl-carrier protein] reductase